MSYYDYKVSKEIASEDYPFASLLMAAMRQADTDNSVKLQTMWPGMWAELHQRYHAPGGRLEGET